MIDNSTLVLFGARGNLAKVKLIPGLFHLDEAGKLPENMKILSVGRQEVNQDIWHSDIKKMLDEKFKSYDKKVFDRFIKRNLYHANLPDDTLTNVYILLLSFFGIYIVKRLTDKK